MATMTPPRRPLTEPTVTHHCTVHDVSTVGVGQEPWDRMVREHLRTAPPGCRIVRTDGPPTIKRRCNGCETSLGDATAIEIACNTQCLPLPDVRPDCPKCWASVDGLYDPEYDRDRPLVGSYFAPDGTTVALTYLPLSAPGQHLAVTKDGGILFVDPRGLVTTDPRSAVGTPQTVKYLFDTTHTQEMTP